MTEKRTGTTEETPETFEALPLLMTTGEVADLSRRNVRTIRNRVSQGKAPRPYCRGPGRLLFTRESVLAWLQGAE